MRAIFTIILAAICCFANSQKIINDANVQLRTVETFHSIEVGSGIDLYFSQGEQAIAVSAKDEESRVRISTVVKDGVLKIDYVWNENLRWKITGGKSLRAYVSAKELRSLSVSGGSDAFLQGEYKGRDLQLALSGGSDFSGKLQLENLIVHVSGGSDAKLSGTVVNLRVDASGGSDFEGSDLQAEAAILEGSGGSDIQATVTKEIAAEASGGSDITWRGKAVVKRSSASGGGKVIQRG